MRRIGLLTTYHLYLWRVFFNATASGDSSLYLSFPQLCLNSLTTPPSGGISFVFLNPVDLSGLSPALHHT